MSQPIQLKQIRRDEVDSMRNLLRIEGFTIHTVGKVTRPEDFVNQAKDAFPLDPPISGNVHWDAFADSLWGGLDSCKQPKIALIVEDAIEFLAGSPREYSVALECLLDSAQGVEDEKRKRGEGEAEIVIVIGAK